MPLPLMEVLYLLRILKLLSLQRRVKSTESWREVLPLSWTQLLHKWKNNKEELWKNPLVLTAKNFLSNKSKYSQILSTTVHRLELTKLKRLLSRVQRKGDFRTWINLSGDLHWSHSMSSNYKVNVHTKGVYVLSCQETILWHIYKLNLFFTGQC